MTPPIPLGFLSFPTVSLQNKFELISSPQTVGASQWTFGGLQDYDNLTLLYDFGGNSGTQCYLQYNGSSSSYEYTRIDGAAGSYTSGATSSNVGTHYRPVSTQSGTIGEITIFDIHNTNYSQTNRYFCGDWLYKNYTGSGVWAQYGSPSFDITSITFWGGSVAWSYGQISLYGWRND